MIGACGFELELRVAFISRLGWMAAGAAALVVCGCSTAQLGDLDRLLYTGGPDRGAANSRGSENASNRLSAPLDPVQRSGDSRTRDYPSQETAAQGARQSVPREPTYGASPPGGAYPYGGRPGREYAGSSGTVASSTPGRAQPSYRRQGLARWRGASWSGHVTTTQERFDPDRLTGAHASLPLPSYLYVTNRANGRTLLIRLNDRPSVAAGRSDDMVVLVSRRVADLLDFSRDGSAQVQLQYAGPAGLVSSGEYEESFLRKQPWYGVRQDRLGQAPERPGAEAVDGRYSPPSYR